MMVRPDRLTELLDRLREAYEVGSPLMVQQRLLCDLSVCLKMRGAPPPPVVLPLSEEALGVLEMRFGQGRLMQIC